MPRPKLKRALISERRRRKDGTFMEYPGMDYPMYMDGRREEHDVGRFAPMRGHYGYEEEEEHEPRSHHVYPYDPFPLVPPIYRYKDRDDWREGMPMNRIGFAPDEVDHEKYGSRINMPHMDEMSHMKGEKTPGHASSTHHEGITREQAMKWVSGMKNADGSIGPHWNLEQSRQIMEQQKIDEDEIEFYIALNMMYSDYCKVAKRNNTSTIEFYAGMAKAFLDDRDAQPEKLTRYYDYIAKH